MEAIDFLETLLSYPHVTVLQISRNISVRWLQLLRTGEQKALSRLTFRSRRR